jgi:thioredoxin-like negative regulator of GroEL
VSQSLLADPQTSGSSFTRNEYSHEVNSAANLLAAHNFTSQAEQAYQIATQLSPGNLAPVEGLAQVLAQTGRADQAQALLDDFANKYPNQRAVVEKAKALWTVTLARP